MNEIKTLEQCVKQSLNIIRYFCFEEDDNFHYIALELCQMDLKEYILKNETGFSFLLNA